MRFFLLLVFLSSCSQKTDQPYYEEIQAFKQSDKQTPPPQNAILFVGSSSFRLWENLPSYFPGHKVINRGFGGSGLNDVIRYADDIIIPYHPKQIVIYCGENDVATGTVTATDVLQRFIELFNKIRKDLPNSAVAYVSMKPSPSRVKYMRVIEDGNIMIRQFLSGYSQTVYIDVYHPMLDKNGEPRKELFREDDLHMNKMGYEIWQAAIAPHLLR